MSLEVYVGEDTSGLTIENTYFNGFNRTDWSVYNMGRRTVLQNCYSIKHDRGFLYNDSKARDTELNRPSHETPTDDFGHDDGFRTRSNGRIVAQDLTEVPGEFEGDEGLHVTDDAKVIQATWLDGAWHNALGEPITTA